MMSSNMVEVSKWLGVTGYITGFWLHLTALYILTYSSCNHVTINL